MKHERPAICTVLVFFNLVLATVGLAATRYVNLNNPTPALPFTSWSTAANTIQDAVDAAAPGDEIVVTNGVYATGGRAVYGTMTNRVAVDKAVTVRSVAGPEMTWIAGAGVGESGTFNGDGAIRCAYVGTNAVLSGFTLTNGHTRATGDWEHEGKGGGAWCEPSGLLTNCTLTGNSALLGGGAYDGTLNNCILMRNYAGEAGGGASGSTLTNCTLTGNSARAGGGAVVSALYQCILIGNSAGSGGGACGSTLSHCTVTGNSASFGGGTYDGTLNNCTLIGNSAQYGGGVYDGTLDGCILTGNSASDGGGAWGSTLNNCTLTGNSAGYDGGGTYYGTLNHCTLTGNSAGANGGGASMDTVLYNCNLTDNSADLGGGAYDCTLNNCTLTGNSAGYDGGGSFYGTLNHCTLTSNSANNGGGASRSTLNNCIAYYNSAPTGPNCYDATLTYSCTTPLAAGPGNIAADPLLASATHLSAQSPCIGRGSPAYAQGVDIDGEVWLNPPCMGADQFVAGASTGALTVAISAAYTNVATGFLVSFVALNTGQIAGSAWEIGDGTVVSNRPYTSHAWDAAGIYEVRLTGYNDSFPGGISATVRVQVVEQEVYYVNAANPTPAFPYTNWAGAAATIQAAIDAGGQMGRLVRVTNGVYATGGRAVFRTMTNRVVVAEGVEVRSENGPSVTFIVGQPAPGTMTYGDGAVRCAYVGTNAVLSGFTLTNGHTRMGWDGEKDQHGGGAWCEASGVLTNCILTSNWAEWNGGGAVGGTLYQCILTGNSAGNKGGGAHGCTLNNCTLTGNSAHYGGGGGASYGTLNHCTLMGNSAGSGGGALECTMNNCIVYYNSTLNYYSSTVSYSCTTPLPAGPGNIADVPLFIDTNGWSNLRPQSNSPCINAGNNTFALDTKDLDGRPRIVGGTVDMGAYEYQSPGMAVFIAWLQQYGLLADGSADFTDSDYDRLNNWQEWLAGTCPTDAASSFRITAAGASSSNNVATLQVMTAPDRVYTLEFCTDLVLRDWQAVPGQTDIPGSGELLILTNPAALPPRFYRVVVRMP